MSMTGKVLRGGEGPALKSKGCAPGGGIMKKTKRGDTIIEVLIAITVMVAIVIFTIAMMKSGLGIAERSLELTTARNEPNAQAEALRFIHSSYVSELNLPECNKEGGLGTEVRCQVFKAAWEKIYGLALEWNDERKIQLPVNSCEEEVYGNDGLALIRDHAFIINTRMLYASDVAGGGVNTGSIIEATNDTISRGVFRMPELNARLLFNNDSDKTSNSDTRLTDLSNYRNLAAAEGIWVVGVKSHEPVEDSSKSYYIDFHIEACWNNAGSNTPSSLDTVIRLYNPEARK